MSLSRTTKVVALSLGKGLNMVGLLAAALVMNRILADDALATYRKSLLLYDVSTNILCTGLFQAMYYFLPGEKVRRRGVVLDGLLLLFGLGILLSLGFVIAGQIAAFWFANLELKHGLLLFAALPFAAMPGGLIAAVLVTQDQVPKLTSFNIIANLLLVTSLISVCWYFQQAMPVVAAKVFVQFLTGVLAVWILWNSVPSDSWTPSLTGMYRMFTFSLPLGIASAFGVIQIHLDRLIVASTCSDAEFVIYTNGAVELPFIGIITGSIATVILPELRRSVAAGDRSGALALFRLVAERSATFLIPLMVLLFVVAEPLMVLLWTEDSRDSTRVFQTYLILLPTRIVTYGSMLVALGLNRLILVNTAVAAGVNLLLCLALVNWLGYTGAAFSTVLTTSLVICLWSLLAIRSAIPCSILEVLPYRKIVEIFGLSLAAALPVVLSQLFTEGLTSLWQVVLGTAIFLLLFVGLAKLTNNQLVLAYIATFEQRFKMMTSQLK